MKNKIVIDNKIISDQSSTYVIAEMSGNHNMDFERAKAIVDAAKYAGADAIKLQTYTADTITLDCNNEFFMTKKGGLWEGMTLHELYSKAYTPWEWHSELKEYANGIGIDLFSSPFDLSAVDFLEDMQVPAYKIASYEINDIPLIRKVARTGKPVIISTGIAYLEDIDLAVRTCREEGNDNIILLKCVSAYPAPFDGMNLRSIETLKRTFGCIVGLSDHTLGTEIAVASVAMGAKVVEKHLTLKRSDGGVDSAFSMEVEEFKEMVSQIRNVEKALGSEQYVLDEKVKASRKGSRSLFVVKDIKAGETITEENVRSIRPGIGMHTKYYESILGRKVRVDLQKGTPMSWEVIDYEEK